jgi:serpin B
MHIRQGPLGAALVLGTCLTTQACAQAGSAPSTEGQSMTTGKPLTDTAARDANAFALDLYARLAANDSENLFFSPTSIATALALAYAGARGETAAEMATALHFSLEGEALHRAVGKLVRELESDRPGRVLRIANALWGQQGYPLREEYLALGERVYGATLREVDFRQATEQARQTINGWVEEQTAGKIRDLFQPGTLDPAVRLVLTNAIYFKGVWLKEFDPQQTRKAPFHVTADETVQVDMMHARDVWFRYFEKDGLQVLELPYAEHGASMIVLLPAEGRSLGSLEGELTRETLDPWIEQMTETRMDQVAIPRFKMTCRYSLPHTLREMGMKKAFTPSADFTGITAADELYLSEVVHKAFVEVNEEGTEAAAATGVALRLTSAAPGKPRIFRADRPFVFLIRDEATGAVLFLGRMADPTAE